MGEAVLDWLITRLPDHTVSSEPAFVYVVYACRTRASARRLRGRPGKSVSTIYIDQMLDQEAIFILGLSSATI
jgi:hypothetical protein